MKMFSKKLKTDSFSSLIAEGTSIHGAMAFTGVLKIQGIVNGDVIRKTTENKECLIVDTLGSIIAEEVNVYDGVIAGHITCKKLWVENTLRVLASAQLQADVIYYRTLEIEPGAKIQGAMKHLDLTSEGEIT
jgi:cytoskeletal protein CcmA (bactofilin family)